MELHGAACRYLRVAGDAASDAVDALLLSESAVAWRSARLIMYYGCIALNDILFNEVFPLWCVAPAAAGGLGLDSSSLGGCLRAVAVRWCARHLRGIDGGLWASPAPLLLVEWMTKRGMDQ